jgi:flagellar hook assembly protein FlgD
LISNYPNPFNSSTFIVFTIPYDLTNANTELKIYNVQGSLIATLINQPLAAGNYIIKWEGKNQNNSDVSSGIYFYSIKVGDRSKSGKMNLLK